MRLGKPAHVLTEMASGVHQRVERREIACASVQAKEVEAPSVLTGAAPQRVTARSRRNTAVVAALIGLVLGAIAALMWDGIAAGFSRRR